MKQTNQQLVIDLMDFGPRGPLSELFIMEAIRRYAEQVANAITLPDSSMFSGEAWKATATHIDAAMTKRLADVSAPAPTPTPAVEVDEDDCNNQFGLFCPKCGASDQLDVTCTTIVRLTPDGTDADEADEGGSGHEWHDESSCSCRACCFDGTVGEFKRE